jgi:hypothetical protein
MDGTALFYRQVPDKRMATHGFSGIKDNKIQLTFAVTTNADGSDICPPFIIEKARKPRCFKGKEGSELGLDYHHNAKGWMTAILFNM